MKNKKESLIIILSCIFAVGLSAFLYFVVFNKERNSLENDKNYQEIKLGDIANCATAATNYNYTQWNSGTWGSWKTSTTCSTAEPGDTTTGTSYCQSQRTTCSSYNECMGLCGESTCYQERTWTRSVTGAYQTCTKCDNGYYLSSGTCIICPAGSYCPNGKDKYSCNSSTEEYSGQGALSCAYCPSGKANSSHTGCESDDVTCQPGEYLPAGATTCASCLKGYKCIGGTYTLGNQYSQGLTPCEENTYQDETGKSECKNVPANSSANPSRNGYICNTGYALVNGQCQRPSVSVTCDKDSLNPGWSTTCNTSLSPSIPYKSVTWFVNQLHGSITSDGVFTAASAFGSEIPVGSVIIEGRITLNDNYVVRGTKTIEIVAPEKICCHKNASGNWEYGKTSDDNSCIGIDGFDTIASCANLNNCCYKNGNSYTFGVYDGTHSCVANANTQNACNELNSGSISEEKICTQTSNSYWINNSCITCPSGYKAKSEINNGKCYIDVPAGSYLESANSTSIVKCAPGSYSTGKDVILGNSYTCTSCEVGKTSNLGATKEADCYELADSSECNVKMKTTVSKGLVSYGSNFTVQIEVTGHGCNGQKLTTRVTNGNLSEGKAERTDKVSDGSGFNFIIDVKDMNVCRSSTTVTATLSGEGTKPSSVTIPTTCEWQTEPAEKDICKADSKDLPKSKDDAEAKGINYYYIVKEHTRNDKECEGKLQVDLYKRSCCSAPSSSNPPADYACYVKGDDYQWETSAPEGYTKVEGISEKGRCIPACYSNGTEYEWTNNPKTGYTQVTKITTSDLCKKEEEACYLYNGNYFWGKYQNTVGYVKQTAIKEEKYCESPEKNPEAACYKNESTNDYVWTDNAPSGYTKVEGVISPNACSLPEVPACYLYNNQYVWGTHGKETGYSFISSVLDEDNCKKPASACYMGNSGTFVWGDYSLDVNYTLIDDSFCKPIDVPKTDLDTAKIIYIGMVVLLVSGIGFIYYVNYNKKKSN